MKKKLNLILSTLVLVCLSKQTISQSTINGFGNAGHFAPANPALYWNGWNALTVIPFNIEHRGVAPAQTINFLTGGVNRMTILNNLGTGFVGIGNNFLAPLFRLDVNENININAPLISQGYRINGNLMVYQPPGLGGTSIFLGQTNHGPLTGPNSTYAGFNAGQNSTAGSTTGMGVNVGINDVGSGGSYFGWQAGMLNTTGDFNTWVGGSSGMNTTTGNTNSGLGVNTGIGLVSGSNNLFLGSNANTTNAALNNGAAIGEFAIVRNDNQIILGNNTASVGIGLSNDIFGPRNKLEINRTGAANPVSGLRLRDLAGATPAAFNNTVLSINAAGDVIVTSAPLSAFGGSCGSAPPAIPSNWEIPMATFNYVFTGQGINTTNVGIGTTCFPQAKLHVSQFSGSNNGSIGLLVENHDLVPCNDPNPVIGIKSVVTNTTPFSLSGLYQVAGWFEAPTPNNCGALNNYAIVVPQGGGIVSLGYSPPTPNFAYLLNINGSAFATGLFTSSDVSLKNSITTLPNSLNKIKSLRPVTFKWNTPHDSAMTGIHAGFIAQEVDTVIPQVVHTDAAGVKSLAYIEMIPYIVSAMQAQQQQIHHQDSLIQVLTQNLNSCCSNNNQNARSGGNGGNATPTPTANQLNVDLSDVDYLVLNQNVPNPYSEQTTITYNIPEKYGYAQLVFKTVDGKIIKTVDITKKGKGQINVFASDLSNGLYMYTLIVDGNVIDSKKMMKGN